MNPTDYLNSVLNRYNTPHISYLPLTPAYRAIYPILSQWADIHLLNINISGSNAKGTAIAGVADLDLFISLYSGVFDTNMTLADIYNSLAQTLRNVGYTVRRQNVSLRVNHMGTEVDIVPGVRFNDGSNDHWLHVTKSGRDRTKTNIDVHINRVITSGMTSEIRLLKIWRELNSLDFPSIYLEETVINYLSRYQAGALDANFLNLLNFLSNNFVNARVVDPANGSNIISDELTLAEKDTIRIAAFNSRRQQNWGNMVS